MAATNKKDQITHIKLSIQVSLDGLSFCALDDTIKKIIFFKDVRFHKRLNPIEVLQQIEKIYDQEPFLKEDDPEVQVLYSNDLYSLVPEVHFQEEAVSDYLKFNTKILETDFVAHDHLEEQKIINVFIPYTNINNFFFDRYGEFEYRHTVSLLVEELMKLNSERPRIYLNKYTAGYDLVVISDNRLILANSFQCNTKEDFIYYLLFTAEQLDLDPTVFELVLLGDIDRGSEEHDIAYTYVKEVSFLKTSFGYIFETKNDPPKGYKYFTLFKALQ